MIPVNQAIFNFKRGDCESACLASLLELPLSEVPNFHDSKEDFDKAQSNWLKAQGYFIVWITANKELEEILEMYYILVGTSPRNQDKLHSVIAHQDKVVHDPHPSKKGIIKKDSYGLLLPIEPLTSN